jgi:hypothetical protein
MSALQRQYFGRRRRAPARRRARRARRARPTLYVRARSYARRVYSRVRRRSRETHDHSVFGTAAAVLAVTGVIINYNQSTIPAILGGFGGSGQSWFGAQNSAGGVGGILGAVGSAAANDSRALLTGQGQGSQLMWEGASALIGVTLVRKILAGLRIRQPRVFGWRLF